MMLGLFFDANAQDKKERSWTLNGYVKNMTSYTLFADSGLLDNLVHNRLNFKWFINPNFKLVAEMRNRFIVGDQLRFNPFYAEGLETSNDYFDLSYTIEDKGNYIVHLMMDRLYLQYTLQNLEIKAGRQRINWGISSAWNPNDIFNAFSYFDFDYEERPGSDAVILKYYTGIASSIEIAGNAAENLDEFTGAGLWHINFKNYDFQVLTGISNRNLVIGGGWAGNIKKAGFKGEASYFTPTINALDTTTSLSATISLDYSFKNSLYLNASTLYSSNGTAHPSTLDQVFYYSGNISAKYLSPYLWSVFVQGAYQFHPLIYGGAAVIGYPGNTDLFLGPYMTFSILQSLDFDIFAQILLSEVNEIYRVTTQAYFFRFKYSF